MGFERKKKNEVTSIAIAALLIASTFVVVIPVMQPVHTKYDSTDLSKNVIPLVGSMFTSAIPSMQPAYATTVTWDGGAGTTNWGDAANWNPDGVPSPTDRIIIDGNSAVSSTVHLNIDVDLSAGGDIEIESGDTLVIDSGITLASNPGSSILDSGTIDNSGSITMGFGALIDNFGTIDNSGTIINNGGSIVQQPGTIITNSGTIANSPGGSISNSGSIVNQPSGTINNDSFGTITISSGGLGGTMSNSGTINNSGDFDNGGTITNFGTFTNNAGTIGTINTFTNFGTIDNFGTFTNNSGGIVNNSGTINNNCGATFTNNGTLTGNAVVNVPCASALTITAPPDVTVNTDPDACSATGVSLGTATTSGGTPPIGVTNNAPGTFPLGTTTVAWTATDSASPPNASTSTQAVTVVDNQPPSITAPADITVTANTAGGATGVDLGIPTFSDNCPGVTVANNAPSTFPLGTTTVTWTATDSTGNTAQAIQTVTVLTPAQAMQNLINTVNAMNLAKGVQTSLTAPLKQSVDLLNDGNPNNDKAVCGKLDAFIKEVNAKAKNGELTTAQADQLRQIANAIKAALGCH